MKKLLKTKLKDKKAITLIALVITIVVLIILAAVAINLTLGDNGIFTRAKTAKQEYANAQVKEEKEIGKLTNEVDSFVNSGSRLTSAEYQELKQEIKNDILNSLQLDYTNKVDISSYTSSSNKFTPTSTGIILVHGSAVSGADIGIVIDGIDNIIFWFTPFYNYGNGSFSKVATPNDSIYIKVQSGASLNCAYFVPFKWAE